MAKVSFRLYNLNYRSLLLMGRVLSKSMEGKNTPIDIKATQTMQIWHKLVNNIKQKSLCSRREVEGRGSNGANNTFL